MKIFYWIALSAMLTLVACGRSPELPRAEGADA